MMPDWLRLWFGAAYGGPDLMTCIEGPQKGHQKIVGGTIGN